jgi:uncharacterized protein
MRIEVDKLDEAGEPFSHRYAPDALDLGDNRAQSTGEAVIEGRASRKRERVRLQGKVRAALEINCDRCLKGVPYILEEKFDVAYAPADSETEKHELQAEDLETDVFEGEFIEIDNVAREQILLHLPARILCKEDCKGLCPVCGADLNETDCGCEQKTIDPRWEALKGMYN